MKTVLMALVVLLVCSSPVMAEYGDLDFMTQMTQTPQPKPLKIPVDDNPCQSKWANVKPGIRSGPAYEPPIDRVQVVQESPIVLWLRAFANRIAGW